MAEANAFLVVPAVEVDGRGGRTRVQPKYAETEGIESYSGNRFTFNAQKHANLPFYEDDVYVCRFYGTRDALDAIASEPDAYAEDEFNGSWASLLNDQFDRDYNPSQWRQRFQIG